MNPAYIIALFQFIFFSFFVMQIEDVRRNQIFAERLSALTVHKNHIESGLYDLEYLDDKNIEYYNFIDVDKRTGKESVRKECKVYEKKNIGMNTIRLPYIMDCKRVRKNWKYMGAYL
ncbi:MAG: hypothetical protein L6Q54_11535 [Leptospiraceae bacterium]|nr:hypothetical protein [Leptospiraceae bacterium]